MGLLDEAKKQYGLLMGYIDANTPRATRPVAKPSKVINEGLINPNKYNAPAANRFKDSAFGLLGVVPGVDTPAGFVEGADLINRGEPLAGAMSIAGGVLPFVPATVGSLYAMHKMAGSADDLAPLAKAAKGQQGAIKGAGDVIPKADDAGGLLGKSANVADMSYQIDHKPMTVAGGASTLDDLTGAFGDDIYGKNALQYFGSGDPREKTTLKLLQAARGNPDKMVTIYRGVPEGVSAINPGDWVTLDRNVAADYGNVIEMQVPARSITSWPDSLLEFGYYPE